MKLSSRAFLPCCFAEGEVEVPVREVLEPKLVWSSGNEGLPRIDDALEVKHDEALPGRGEERAVALTRLRTERVKRMMNDEHRSEKVFLPWLLTRRRADGWRSSVGTRRSGRDR